MFGLAGILSFLMPFGKIALQSALGIAQQTVSDETKRQEIEASVVKAHLQNRADVLLRGVYVVWFWFAIPLALYWAKVVVWDTMLGLGTTPALKGMTLEWANLILGAIFLVPLGGSAISRWKSK